MQQQPITNKSPHTQTRKENINDNQSNEKQKRYLRIQFSVDSIVVCMFVQWKSWNTTESHSTVVDAGSRHCLF